MLVVKIKKQKGKKYAIKRKCKFEDYKNFLETSQLSNKNKSFENEVHSLH